MEEKRLIDAVRYERILQGFAGHLLEAGKTEAAEAVNTLIKGLKLEPTVDVVEVVHGRWEPRQDVIGFVRCSVCHDCNIYGDWADGKKWNYCPNCGAKMDGDGNG